MKTRRDQQIDGGRVCFPSQGVVNLLGGVRKLPGQDELASRLDVRGVRR